MNESMTAYEYQRMVLNSLYGSHPMFTEADMLMIIHKNQPDPLKPERNIPKLEFNSVTP